MEGRLLTLWLHVYRPPIWHIDSTMLGNIFKILTMQGVRNLSVEAGIITILNLQRQGTPYSDIIVGLFRGRTGKRKHLGKRADKRGWDGKYTILAREN